MIDHDHSHDSETKTIATAHGAVELSIFEQGIPPRFRLKFARAAGCRRCIPWAWRHSAPDGSRQSFRFAPRRLLGIAEEIPEPHEFKASLHLAGRAMKSRSKSTPRPRAERQTFGSAHRDNNIRSAYIHVMADAAVSVLAITGLVLARGFGWMWMDPLAGVVGALVIANWSYGLVRDTGRILLDMNPDPRITSKFVRRSSLAATGSSTCTCGVWVPVTWVRSCRCSPAVSRLHVLSSTTQAFQVAVARDRRGHENGGLRVASPRSIGYHRAMMSRRDLLKLSGAVAVAPSFCGLRQGI